ncbi:unnamed protein product [Euphydryas editha]|uniref:MARVEL domain-containing protein n=1 Tax=Euphydryas editha TaxID=104508 RepID=A0AAU9TIF9_EUPED|nr:unnamed protein product [Euphydryas editha]
MHAPRTVLNCHFKSNSQILGILCMSLGTPWASAWYVFVAVTSFITTLLWSFVYLLSIREALKIPINWVLSELISTTIETLFYLIAFIVMFTSLYGNYGRNVAAAVFGIFNTLAYAASSYFLFQEHRSNAMSPAA